MPLQTDLDDGDKKIKFWCVLPSLRTESVPFHSAEDFMIAKPHFRARNDAGLANVIFLTSEGLHRYLAR